MPLNVCCDCHEHPGCCDFCDRVLLPTISIEVITHDKEGEKTLCHECWADNEEEMRESGWRPECDEESEEDADEWFDRKFPECTCFRCHLKLDSTTVIFCGGGGGDCETWYCQDCHEEGTEDCEVCQAMK